MIFQVVVGKELVSSALPRLKSTNSRFLSLEAASHNNIFYSLIISVSLLSFFCTIVPFSVTGLGITTDAVFNSFFFFFLFN